tara:strand:+ start:449 stop:2521 length:2073 start_codon:yes stop_codon:yes gene_type:complete
VLKVSRHFITKFLVISLFNSYIIFAQLESEENTNQTQDWIFGDGPEPKWVIELLHGAYQNIKEDSKFVLKVPVTGSGIKYNATVDGHATIERDGDYLIISPEENYHGSIMVNLSLDMSFILNVQSVNDMPVITKIKNHKINEDEQFKLKLSAKDAEDDALTYGATVDGNAKVVVVNDNLIIIPKENYYGPINVNVAVSDGKGTDETNFTLNIDAVNDAPVLKSFYTITKDDNNQVDLMLTGTDIDGDNLVYSVESGNNSKVDVRDNKISIKPNEDYIGSTPITLTTSDGISSIDTSFTLINPIPGFTAFAPQTMLEDSVLTLLLNIQDAEKDPFTYRIKKNENADLEINGDELKIIPKKDYNGDLSLSLTISDGVDSTDFSFNINVLPVPDKPIALAGKNIIVSDGCNSSVYLDGSKSWDPDNDRLSFSWKILDEGKIILSKDKGDYHFLNENEDRIKKILLTVSDPTGLIGNDTIIVKIINDEAPVANAGVDFVAPFDRKVYLDGTKTNDKDSKIIYDWSIISGDVAFSKEESKKQSPYFLYPSEINESRLFTALLKVRDKESYCYSQDTVNITCLPNVDIADKNVKYEILRASKENDKVFVDLNVTNKQSWPFDFAAFTLITVVNENNNMGQIDPYRGKNTVKYGIENGETVEVELVYNFDSSPQWINIMCKSTMALKADTVSFKQIF